jgi:hypothetical protein
MNTKHYVSLEAARLLKEKGYNEECEQIIKEDGETLYGYNVNYKLPVTLFSCPAKAEAIDWLESKGVIVEFQYYQEFSAWSYAIYCICYMSSDEEFPTRLEAEDAAIIKALELL